MAQFYTHTAINFQIFPHTRNFAITSKEVLCYGSKIWTIHKRNALIHEVEQITFLRPLLCLTKLDRLISFEISNILKVEKYPIGYKI